MRPLILREAGAGQLVELPDSVAATLRSSDLLTVLPAGRPGWWLLTAGRKVGAVRVGDLQIVIEPKIEIHRLVFLMGYAREPNFWRNHEVTLDAHSGLMEALTESFGRLALRAVEQGVLKGYRTVDESAAVMRGRIREAEQIKQRFGRLIPLEIRYDDFTVDVAENQLLLTAALQLLRTTGAAPKARQRLHRLRLLLADVTPMRRGSSPPTWQPTRLNARYQPALRLAELILDGDSFEQQRGDLRISGYVFDMWRIFEDFVSVALTEAMRGRPGRASLQHRAWLDEDRSVDIRPDFVWQRDGRVELVVDAKYKAEKPSGFPQADLYQLLAYCTVFELTTGHLIYAAGNEIPKTHRVQGSPVSITTHTLDLAQDPDDLLRCIGDLASRL